MQLAVQHILEGKRAPEALRGGRQKPMPTPYVRRRDPWWYKGAYLELMEKWNTLNEEHGDPRVPPSGDACAVAP